LKYGEVVKAIHAQGTHTSTTATKDAPHILSYLPNLYLRDANPLAPTTSHAENTQYP
jgi:hypothetical protein